MGQDFLQGFLFVHLLFHEIGRSHRPHDEPHGNQEYGGIQETQRAIYPFRHRIPQEPAIGSYGAVLEHFFLSFRKAVEEDPVQYQINPLDYESCQQNPSADAQYIFSQRRQAGLQDVADGYDDALSSYQKRVDTFLQLSAKKIDFHNEDVLTSKICEDSTSDSYHVSDDSVFSTELKSSYPRNRIIFGAPGTGKSWQLDTDKNKLLENGGEFERVTFHPDYTYSQFVGAYKPTTDENGEISYQFIPGPFMRIYVNALKNSRTDYPLPYLLIIEEINRARVASVFGDVFQLLDRKEDETSQYAIQASEDIKKYLAAELGGYSSDYPILKLPNNMFLWATMNSADQGVYPMDTAFKSRWTFEYIGIDAKQEKAKCTVNLVKNKPETNINWNRLRKAINAKLLDTCRVNEDKLLGPFFLSQKAIKADEDKHIIDEDAFRKAFKSKVIMYLFEDAARQYRSRLFKSDICKMYSSICDEFDKHGMAIFGDDFKSAYYDQQKD